MQNFMEFVDKRKRDAKHHLDLIKKLLERGGMKVSSHLNKDDSYIFVESPVKNLSFDGVRIYQIGDIIAYRVQKEEETHPFGRSYPLEIEEMFYDFLSDEESETKAGELVAKTLIFELKNFFEKSEAAEKKLRTSDFDGIHDPLGKVITRSSETGTDYANLVYNKTN